MRRQHVCFAVTTIALRKATNIYIGRILNPFGGAKRATANMQFDYESASDASGHITVYGIFRKFTEVLILLLYHRT